MTEYLNQILIHLNEHLKQKTEQMKQQEQQRKEQQQQAQAQQNFIQLQYELFRVFSQKKAPNYLDDLHFQADLSPRGYNNGKFYFGWSKSNTNTIPDIILQNFRNDFNNHIVIFRNQLTNSLLFYPNIQLNYRILLQTGFQISAVRDKQTEILLEIS